MATSTRKPTGNAPKTDAKETAAPAVKPSGDRRMMAMIAAFAVLSAGASAGAVYMVTRTQINVVAPAAPAMPTRDYPGPTYAMGDFIVNLGGAESRRFLKVSMALGFQTHNDDFVKLNGAGRDAYLANFADDMKQREPKLKDVVNMTLSGFSAQELGTLQGKQQLKQTLISRLERLMPPEVTLNDIYFQEFLIQ